MRATSIDGGKLPANCDCHLWHYPPTMTPLLPTSEDDLPALVSFLDSFVEPRIVIDGDYRIVAANRAYHETFGAKEPLRGRYCYEVSHRFDRPCDEAGESCPLALARSSGSIQRVLHLHHTPRGEEHVLVETAPILDHAGRPRYFVETVTVVRHASSRVAGQGLVGRSPAFRRMLDRLMRVAPAEANVLLLGETGTGKEVAARVVHEASTRCAGPFVAVDCSGLTETLFESELFGHEKGAFTGASHRKIGLVESARGGTLFLDEIGDVPLAMQVKLLRLLETGTFRRVGGIENIGADFRLVAATHRDLTAMVHAGGFRADLYYRINTFPVRMPALAERGEDIALLAESLLDRVDRRAGRRLAPDAVALLANRRYEGNIRELRNLIERAALLADGDTLEARHFEEDDLPGSIASVDAFILQEPVSLDELEDRYLAWVRGRLPGERGRLALRLGISERTLFRKLRGGKTTGTPRRGA